MTIWNPPRYAEDIVLRPYELFHDPPVDVSCFGTEVDPNAEYLAGVLCEREGILLLLYLLQGLLCRAVELELHYVHIVHGLHHHVDPAVCTTMSILPREVWYSTCVYSPARRNTMNSTF